MPYISGFSGSSGHMVVTADEALLWTDGRYFLQAETELAPGWSLMKLAKDVPRYNEWLSAHMPRGAKVGFDPYLLSTAVVNARTREFAAIGVSFVAVEVNLVNEIWTDRPEIGSDPVMRLSEKFAGESMREKLNKVGNVVGKHSAEYLFVSRLDEIAWVLNLRGTDIPYNPVFFAYFLAHFRGDTVESILFVNVDKVKEFQGYFSENNVEIRPYEAAFQHLSTISAPILVGDDLNSAIFSQIQQPKVVSEVIIRLKSLKNPTEILGTANCHIRDGRAVCRYLAWLENELKTGRTDWDEYSAAMKLAEFRSEGENFKGLSFETISAVGENAAVIHYAPKKDSAAAITMDKIYLLDSGGHYLDGTTDITRTVHFGTPSQREKECFTRVLLGNLDLCRAVWPSNTTISGADMDILARRWLWQAGLDYNHGTGHGVGYFLNVHEGPQGISRARNTPLVPGMNVTDEPGYYEQGAFGIRIEDVLFVQNCEHPAGFLCFQNVTMCPYDLNLIDRSLLSQRDVDFVNAYHQRVWTTLAPTLMDDQVTYQWLQRATAAIS